MRRATSTCIICTWCARNNATRLQAHLAAHGIATAIHYPVPVHKQPAYRHFAPPPTHQEANRLIETERAAAEVLSLPLYPQLPIEHLDRIAAAIAQFAASI